MLRVADGTGGHLHFQETDAHARVRHRPQYGQHGNRYAAFCRVAAAHSAATHAIIAMVSAVTFFHPMRASRRAISGVHSDRHRFPAVTQTMISKTSVPAPESGTRGKAADEHARKAPHHIRQHHPPKTAVAQRLQQGGRSWGRLLLFRPFRRRQTQAAPSSWRPAAWSHSTPTAKKPVCCAPCGQRGQ